MSDESRPRSSWLHLMKVCKYREEVNLHSLDSHWMLAQATTNENGCRTGPSRGTGALAGLVLLGLAERIFNFRLERCRDPYSTNCVAVLVGAVGGPAGPDPRVFNACSNKYTDCSMYMYRVY